MAKNELISLALIYSEPRHAYALNAIIKEMNLEHWAHISQASIYSALNRLASTQCVEVSADKVGNMPERKVYSITEAGKERLRKEVREALGSTGMGDNPFYLAVAFAFGVSAEEMIATLEERIRQIEVGQVHMKGQLGHLDEVGAKQAHIMVEAGIEHMRVEVRAATKLVELLRDDPDFYERDVTRQLRQIHTQDRQS
jgi:DNA-binding PadR family transcriptional regulator